jgi:hypothetical protein
MGFKLQRFSWADACAAAQEVSRRFPTAAARVQDRAKSSARYVVDRQARGRVSPNASVSVPIIHSTNFSTIIALYHPGPVQ